jgi:hypothetical protein
MRILGASPYRPTLHPDLLRVGAGLRAAAIATATEAGYQVDVAIYADPVRRESGEPRYAGHARVRNATIERFLLPEHDAVLWVDADLVRYPAEIIPALDAVRWGGIAAPAVYLDKEAPGRWYDTAGFIEAPGGRHTPIWPPHFRQPGPVVELLSVGCIYLMPADVFHAGHRYAAPPEPYVEHWTIMEAARAMGYPIRADLRLEAYHAYLPSYGEAWHTGHE